MRPEGGGKAGGFAASSKGGTEGLQRRLGRGLKPGGPHGFRAAQWDWEDRREAELGKFLRGSGKRTDGSPKAPLQRRRSGPPSPCRPGLSCEAMRLSDQGGAQVRRATALTGGSGSA